MKIVRTEHVVQENEYVLEVTDEIRAELQEILIARGSKVKLTDKVITFVMDDVYNGLEDEIVDELDRELDAIENTNETFRLYNWASCARDIIESFLNEYIWDQDCTVLDSMVDYYETAVTETDFDYSK